MYSMIKTWLDVVYIQSMRFLEVQGPYFTVLWLLSESLNTLKWYEELKLCEIWISHKIGPLHGPAPLKLRMTRSGHRFFMSSDPDDMNLYCGDLRKLPYIQLC